MPTPLLLSYHSKLAVRRSAYDQNRICTIALSEYVFMAGARSVISARDGAYPSDYTCNHRLDRITGRLSLLLPPEILDSLKYFGLYTSTCRTGASPVLSALAFPRCRRVNWDKSAMRNAFACYKFCTGEVCSYKEEEIQAKKRVRGFDGVPTTVTRRAVSITLRANVSRTDLAPVRQDYGAYRQRESVIDLACGAQWKSRRNLGA